MKLKSITLLAFLFPFSSALATDLPIASGKWAFEKPEKDGLCQSTPALSYDAGVLTYYFEEGKGVCQIKEIKKNKKGNAQYEVRHTCKWDESIPQEYREPIDEDTDPELVSLTIKSKTHITLNNVDYWQCR